MSISIYYLSVFISLVFLVLVIELVRRRKLKEQYSLLWIFLSGFMVLFSLRSDLIEYFSLKIGVLYPPSALFLFGLLISLLLILHFSVIISKLTSQHIQVAQQLAILTNQVRELEEQLSNSKVRNMD